MAKIPEKVTIGEKYGRCLEVKTEAEALEHFRDCVRHSMKQGYSYGQAVDVERQNLGYYIGYVEPRADRDRIYSLYALHHPYYAP
jgi:hypothetical protein